VAVSLTVFFFFFFFLFVEEGFPITVEGRREISKGILLTATADTPAKAEMQNFTHHNGFFGCSFCLNAGHNVSTEIKKTPKNPGDPKKSKQPKKKGSVHVYPPGKFPQRTKGETLADAAAAFKSGHPV